MKKYSFLARFIITIFLLYIVYATIDKKLLVSVIKNSSKTYLILSLLVFIISNITGAVQWYFLLKSQKLKIKFSRTVRVYLMGTFFNNFMPSNIGGDIVKAYRLIKEKSQAEIIISSIVWDRVISLLILFIFSIVSALFLFKNILFFYILISTFLIIGVLIILILKYNLGSIFLAFAKKIPYPNIKLFVYNFFKSFKRYIIFSKEILYFYLISIFTQFLKTFIQVLINSGFNYDLTLTEIYFFIPLIGIISALPISINGIGLRELLGKYFASVVKREPGIISFFISVGNIIIILGNLTGVVFIFNRKNVTTPQSTIN